MYKNITTLGDIFENIETEKKAYEFLNYIKTLQQENKQLKEVIDKAIEYIENLQNEYNNSSVNESNIYIFSAYLHGVSKLIEIKEILKGGY